MCNRVPSQENPAEALHPLSWMRCFRPLPPPLFDEETTHATNQPPRAHSGRGGGGRGGGGGSRVVTDREDCDHDVSIRVSVVPKFGDLLANGIRRKVQVVLCIPVVGHQRERIVIQAEELVLVSGYVWHLHVVGRGFYLVHLGTGEDVNRHELALGVPVFPGLRDGHGDDLARVALNHQHGALPARRCLLRVRLGTAGALAFECWLIVVRHDV